MIQASARRTHPQVSEPASRGYLGAPGGRSQAGLYVPTSCRRKRSLQRSSADILPTNDLEAGSDVPGPGP